LSDDGSNGAGHYSVLNIANCLHAGLPSLVTVTYDYITDGTSQARIYCNDLATALDNTFNGPVYGSAADLSIGAGYDGVYRTDASLPYCDFSNGVVLTEADHDAAYAMFVQSYVLPKRFGGAGEPDKLTISFDAKCEWSGSADIGSIARDILEISGGTGTATATRNRLTFEVVPTGQLYAFLSDDADVDHYVNTMANPVDFSEWNNFWFVIDFSDFSRMEFWLNGVAGFTKTGASGTADFNLIDTKIRIGQQWDGTVESCCQIENLDIRAQEIRP